MTKNILMILVLKSIESESLAKIRKVFDLQGQPEIKIVSLAEALIL